MCICLVRAFLFSIFLRFYVVRKYIFLLTAIPVEDFSRKGFC
ncbi:hypothetical protein APHCRT_1026 [Anaplasma phagocytophilum str. CRT53-1]|uniref:Uncharacterized protein n=1 Tax=Anaplasma phagocytophilum str. CRT53-1 TaxID=1359157 RepID=A0A0F3PV34_ANAPH|nr:hypothetical protein APHCRT_1026 [Anaplasma phagocytophilum str. CRT53-1]